MERKWLAYRIFPEPLGTTYQDYDLTNRADVEKLFDYCQILEAMISRQGWQFLINHLIVKALKNLFLKLNLILIRYLFKLPRSSKRQLWQT
ncbi:hypothetical protein [Paenibacillus sp. TY11]|uniref:hypothetical protein n=1 Tax=Paenibacillus sp. TY11 TaxID=3448633 RepID=UPI00403977EE